MVAAAGLLGAALTTPTAARRASPATAIKASRPAPEVTPELARPFTWIALPVDDPTIHRLWFVDFSLRADHAGAVTAGGRCCTGSSLGAMIWELLRWDAGDAGRSRWYPSGDDVGHRLVASQEKESFPVRTVLVSVPILLDIDAGPRLRGGG